MFKSFFSVCVCQGSAVRPCLSGWSGESSHVKDTQLISAAPGVMSLWSRRPTTAEPTTRSATLTRSRWRTSTATSRMPTRLYRKGKMLEEEGFYFTNIIRSWKEKVWTMFFFLSLTAYRFCTQKKQFKLSLCSCSHLHTGQLINISHVLNFCIPSLTGLCRWQFKNSANWGID